MNKKIDAVILYLLLDKLKIIANWCYEAEKIGIGEALETVIAQFQENTEDCK